MRVLVRKLRVLRPPVLTSEVFQLLTQEDGRKLQDVLEVYVCVVERLHDLFIHGAGGTCIEAFRDEHGAKQGFDRVS